MKKTVYFIAFMIFPLLCEAAELIDSFESYSLGSIGSEWVQTDGTTIVGQETSGNQYLQSYGCYLSLDTYSIDSTDTETTVFYRIYQPQGSSPDCSIGLSYLSEPEGDWNDFEAYVTFVDGNMKARDNTDNTTIILGVTEAVWYNVWLIVNNYSDTYDIYVTTGTDDATVEGAQKGNDFGFRNDAGDLLSFKIYGRDTASVRVDDIYVSRGTNLSVPTAQYEPDEYTLHLYHFDDGSDSAGSFDIAAYSGASIGNSTLSTYDAGAGTTGNICADDSGYTTFSDLSNFTGTDGSFTFEAMVKPMMEPSTASNQEIICCESDSSNTDRGFQFRIESAGDTLRFQTLSSSTAAYDAEISYSSGNWYHAAVAYDAPSQTLAMYWTPKGETITQVGLWTSVAALDGSTSTRFCIGNELRSISGYGNENFEGLIDEVRISSIARQPSDMSTAGIIPNPEFSAHPSDSSVYEADNASFDAVFTSAFVPTVRWFKIDDKGDVVMDAAEPDIDVQTTYDLQTGRYNSTLTLTGVETPDAGKYYCQADNGSGYPKNSETASLIVYGLTAHWTLDQDKFSSGYYLEEVAGHNACVNGAPVFVTGADGNSSGAVRISADNGWGLSTQFDPVKQTGKLTVSLWANWAETSMTEQDIIVDSPDAASLTDTDGLKSDGNWQHICSVFDGTTAYLYVNGVLADRSAWSLPTKTTALINIGLDATAQNPFNGSIDEIKIYNYALSQTQVADLRYEFDGQSSCILAFDETYDLSGPDGKPDCVIDEYDLSAFADRWLSQPDDYRLAEFADLAAIWMSSGLYPYTD